MALGKSGRHLLLFLSLLGVAVAGGASAETFRIAVIDARSGHAAVPDPFNTSEVRDKYFHHALAPDGAKVNRADILSYDNESKTAVAWERLQWFFVRKKGSIVIARNVVMSSFAADAPERVIGAFGKKNPFPNIADEYKQYGDADKKSVRWFVIGWIAKSHVPKDDVSFEKGTYVIRLHEGSPGWPAYAVALHADAEKLLGTNRAHAYPDWMASPEANEVMGDWFYVVPDNTKLKRRVRIDLVDKETKQVVRSTKCDVDSCMPRLGSGAVTFKNEKTGRDVKVCGPAAACPQFYTAPK